ncbi:ABC transporter ATP-binding protein [Noviherbaspirillum denitrificans]|uniref:Copper ABC transporter ATP-binding protein n=1 Tax=Noviherbaspirillum denitrificans TaxID=1968433 RepID=A0A254TLG1_9BURK|nr:ABC transporter ATP-binding protein [Noviherbaspirillum denitrificans]OWW21453.1 copper ABC transporter ATP-binding protein [Noviherbaspirillum denitrificans]
MTSVPIQVTEVTKRFGDVQALDGVSLTVQKGEMFGLIGHNGAGKSTLFKLMLGLAPVSGGEVCVHGVSTGGKAFRDVRRRIGYLPENFVTYDNLTGLEVLRLFADLKRVPRCECDALLERVGLGAASGRRVRGYSKGMRQRLGFAQVLLGNPDLIFLDEPTNGLDAEGIHEFYRILRDVQEQGATIVITSHILAEIQERVDRLVILSSGKVAAQGTIAQLRAQMVLPSIIEVNLHPGYHQEVHGALSRAEGLQMRIGEDVAHISCAQSEKVAVLQILSTMAHAVRDISIREPSLEDLFLGYGGQHA